jgi:hypothetical protein
MAVNICRSGFNGSSNGLMANSAFLSGSPFILANALGSGLVNKLVENFGFAADQLPILMSDISEQF